MKKRKSAPIHLGDEDELEGGFYADGYECNDYEYDDYEEEEEKSSLQIKSQAEIYEL